MNTQSKSDPSASVSASVSSSRSHSPVPPARLRPRFQILVECRDEEDQRAFHARMVAERRKCRVLTL